MATVNPPFALQNAGATHTAENDRMMLSGLMAGVRTSGTTMTGRGGVHPTAGSEFNVAQTSTPSMNVEVSSGVIFVSGSEAVKQGVYACTNDGTVTITVSTAHGTLPRIDTVVARVYDSFYSGATNTWALEVVTGTPASSPVAPTLPNNCEPIANIAVGAAVTSIVNGNITDKRKWVTAAGGIIPTSTTPSTTGFGDGQFFYTKGSRKLEVIDGGVVTYPILTSRAAMVTRTTATSITSGGSGTSVSWENEDFDNANLFTLASPTQIVLPVGSWSASFQIEFAANATGIRVAAILVGGTVWWEQKALPASGTTATVNVSGIVTGFITPVTVEFRVLQTSGAGLNLNTARAAVAEIGSL